MNKSRGRLPINIPAIIVGVFAILTALFGLYYNATSLMVAFRGAFDQVVKQDDEPYFYPAFYIMSVVCLLCYVALVVCGFDLVRCRLRWSGLAIFILLLEVGYFFAVGSLWFEPTIGGSVAAATGVANGGLMAQFVILFPLWGPLTLWWARSKQRAGEAASVNAKS
jgi:hypothetical protein